MLEMGVFDRISSFFENRSEDFVRIESMDDKYGPPVLLLFGFPKGIGNDEVQDMVADGAPVASSSEVGIRVKRIDFDNYAELRWMDLTVKDALQGIMEEPFDNTSESSSSSIHVSALQDIEKRNIDQLDEVSLTNEMESLESWKLPQPVIYCSGLSNNEMMATYRIIAREIYEETGGNAQAACAKAVAPAMEKTVRRVIMEITGDHMDAIGEDPDAS